MEHHDKRRPRRYFGWDMNPCLELAWVRSKGLEWSQVAFAARRDRICAELFEKGEGVGQRAHDRPPGRNGQDGYHSGLRQLSDLIAAMHN
ncbi:hypothetical protein FQZ97_869590 [compost metagenome]